MVSRNAAPIPSAAPSFDHFLLAVADRRLAVTRSTAARALDPIWWTSSERRIRCPNRWPNAVPRRQFDDDFKAQAVRLVLDEGKSVGSVARDLDLTETALRTAFSAPARIAP